jgi:Copper chaperone
MVKTYISVQRISCDNCANAIEAALTRLEGVSAAQVFWRERLVLVVHNPDMMSEAELQTRIMEQGFTVM